MSYIFDALKKLEYDRHRSKSSNIGVSQGALMNKTKTRKIWPYILAGSFVLNAVILLLWLQPWRADKAIPPVQSAVQPKQELPPQTMPKEAPEVRKEAVSVQPSPVKTQKSEPDVVKQSPALKTRESIVIKPVLKDVKTKNSVAAKAPAAKRHNEIAPGSPAAKNDTPVEHDEEGAPGSGALKVWIDEHGNKHFSGSVGGR